MMNTPVFNLPNYTYRTKVLRVVDGDTIDVQLDVGFKCYLTKRLRFLGMNAWETRGEEKEKGKLAKARLQELVDMYADRIYVQTEMDAEGKYGRVLAWVWVQDYDPDTFRIYTCLNEQMVFEEHAR